MRPPLSHQDSVSALYVLLITVQILSHSKGTFMRGTTACSFEPSSCNGESLGYQPEKAWSRLPLISTHTGDMKPLDHIPSNTLQSGSKARLRRLHILHSPAHEPTERFTPPSL
jgi:hypothetical protein